MEKQAVRVLSLAESAKVRKDKGHRIIDTRFVLTLKKGDDGTEVVKARWVARGFKDPDALMLVYRGATAAPTVSHNARTTALQIIASNKWDMEIGDIKGAFMESDPLNRPEGPLFAQQPHGGIPGLAPGQLVELGAQAP